MYRACKTKERSLKSPLRLQSGKRLIPVAFDDNFSVISFGNFSICLNMFVEKYGSAQTLPPATISEASIAQENYWEPETAEKQQLETIMNRKSTKTFLKMLWSGKQSEQRLEHKLTGSQKYWAHTHKLSADTCAMVAQDFASFGPGGGGFDGGYGDCGE